MYLRCGNQILKSLPSPSSPFFPCFSPNPQPPVPLLSALLLSLIEFNSAQGDSVIDRLRETEEIQFKLNSFFSQCTFCVKSFFFSFTVPWALQLIASSKPPPLPLLLLLFFPPHLPFPPHWNLASHSCLTRCERERKRRRRDGGQGEAISCGEWGLKKRVEKKEMKKRRGKNSIYICVCVCAYKSCSTVAGNLMWESKHKFCLFRQWLALSLETTYQDHTMVIK